jgi:hypothetical protein
MSTNNDVFEKNKYNKEFTSQFKKVQQNINKIVTIKTGDNSGLISQIPKDMMSDILVNNQKMGRVYYIPTTEYLKIIKDKKLKDTSININLQGNNNV